MFRYPVYGKAKSPIIPFRVLGKHGWKVVWAYVDSGASYSILSGREAERLGLELRNGRKIFEREGEIAFFPNRKGRGLPPLPNRRIT